MAGHQVGRHFNIAIRLNRVQLFAENFFCRAFRGVLPFSNGADHNVAVGNDSGQIFIVIEHRYGAHVFIAHHSGNVFQSGIQAGSGQPFRRHNVAHLHGTFSFVAVRVTDT